MKTAPTAMAFLSPAGLEEGWAMASAWAGAGGRVASMPDVVDERVATAPGTERPGGASWNNWFTTSTSEFLGKTPGGVDVVAVLHGEGPMSDPDGILAAYAHEYEDETRSRRGGRIDGPTWRRVLETADVVPFDEVVKSRRWPFSSMTGEQALADPLMRARLGGEGRLAAYVAVAQAISDEDRARNGEDPGHTVLAQAVRDELRSRGIDTLSPRRDGPALTMRMSDPNNCGYSTPVGPDGRFSVADDAVHRARSPEVGALAHLLSVGSLVNSHESGRRLSSIQTDFGAQECRDNVRFVGMRAGHVAGSLHPGVDLDDAMADPKALSELWIDCAGTAPSLSPLVRVAGSVYAESPKVGERMDTGVPWLLATSLESLGAAPFRTTIGGYHGFFKYGLDEVAAIAPPGANAYEIVDGPEIHGEFHVATLEFYRAAIDPSRRLVTKTELARDPERMMRVMWAMLEAA